MKTLLALLPLVCLALAAPAANDNGFKITFGDQASLATEEITREKKSPHGSLLQPSAASPNLDDQTDVTNIEDEDLSPSARSFKKFKGPIVVRKKTGYHVYRDSDEERAAADSHEKCDKHLRVKLCNEEFTGKSTNKRNTEEHNEKDSIKAAHAAIERLRKDVEDMENGKTDSLQNDNAASKTILKETVDIINNALQQLENSRTLKKVSHEETVLSSSKTEAQKHAEWKEMTKNSEHSTDIVKNFEDNFKSADHHFTPSTLHKSTGMMMTDHHLHQNHHMHKSSGVQHSTHHKSMEIKSGHHMHQFRTHGEEMATAASEQVNNKLISHKNVHHNTMEKTSKSADDLLMNNQDNFFALAKNSANFETKKAIEHESQTKSSEKNWQNSALSHDSVVTGDISTAQRSNVESSHIMVESAAHDTKHISKEGNTRTALTEDLKNNAHLNPLIHAEALTAAVDSSVSVQGKAVEQRNENHETKTQTEEHKSSHHQSHNGDGETDIMMQLKGQHTGMEHTSGHDSHMSKNNHDHHASHGKSAMEFDTMMQPSNHIMMQPSNHMMMHPGNQMMFHPSNPMMRGWNAKSALGNVMEMNWKHHPNAARSYEQTHGGYGGSSAVGLFPNAKVGGCAIPILLSCSPSVSHGKLVKSHYSAPAYRTVEDNESIQTHEMKMANSPTLEDNEKHPTTK